MSAPPTELLDWLSAHKRFVITSHSNPDGDAIGSSLALQRLLRASGKEASVWLRDAVPSNYLGLAGAEDIHVGLAPPADWNRAAGKADAGASPEPAVIWLECPTPDRSGLEEHLLAKPGANIDHHLGNSGYGCVQWVDSSAAAVALLVQRLATALELDLDVETASALYLALVSDTGGFRYSNADRNAFEAAAALVTAGASPQQTAEQLYEQRSAAAIRLVGQVLQSLELHGAGRLATIVLTQADLRCVGATAEDSEGLIDYPRSIANVEAVGLLRELSETEYKASLRSRGRLDVERIARRHGGGGHRNAAGCVLRGPLDQNRRQLVYELERGLAEAGSDAPELDHGRAPGGASETP